MGAALRTTTLIKAWFLLAVAEGIPASAWAQEQAPEHAQEGVPPAPQDTSVELTPSVDALQQDQAGTPVTEVPADIEEFDMESLLNEALLDQTVVSSTKVVQRAAATPAVVTVIRGDEIRARGYASLAEVLRTVPGFYDLYDLVGHNVGVRGINGGVRDSGSVIKVMIDGHAVAFRPTTGNFFGEELIPLQVVDRVEIIRGPASALYGANAFLGVVNIITKSGLHMGARATGRGVIVDGNRGGGGGLV
ncbi:MAG: TonB-dependent receptor plug domain-containing protein, partial [Deltaproteobacteria bacterium]|nr:TonB-dependent receptor plug domain-containing protein [Deltaproteobacteria bacterium]